MLTYAYPFDILSELSLDGVPFCGNKRTITT